MVFENLVPREGLLRRPDVSAYFGAFIVILAFITSTLLFSRYPHLIGMSTILFVVILAAPTFTWIIGAEERLGARARTRGKERASFWTTHKNIIDFCIYFFIGTFLAFFVLSLAFPARIFSERDLIAGGAGIVQPMGRALLGFAGQAFGITPGQEILGILINNVLVMLLSFVLSLFYGMGALFILTLNASVFAAGLANAIRLTAPVGIGFLGAASYLTCNLGIMFLHTIPELGSYILAAIAGGVLSKAVATERFGSDGFFRVTTQAARFLLWAFVAVALGSVIEILVSKQLFMLRLCDTNTVLPILVAVVLLALLVVLEIAHRKRHGH